MTREVITISPGPPIFEAASLLYENRIRCLPVVENDELVGVITTTEMLKLLVRLFHDQQVVSR